MTIDLSANKEFIEKIRKYAVEHYNEDGWDFLVETWEDSDVLDACEGYSSFEDAIKKIAKVLKVQDDYRKEIQSTAF